jgi:chemotaxis protein methyltransferase CheR
MRVKITNEEMIVLGKFIKDKSGIVLDESKAYLFESRLSPLLDELNCPNYMMLYERVRKDYSNVLTTRLIDAVCTNETSFFRDKSPFLLIVQKLAPDFYEKNPSGTLSVWSAASSTGQEVYSVIMQLTDAGICAPRFKMKFLGTDISDFALTKASRGRYSKFELARGMEGPKLHKYFVPVGEEWAVKDEIRSMVMFRKANLLDPANLSLLGKFDVILCRNVAIYFSNEDKRKLFNCLATMLHPGGTLLIGSTESLFGVTDRFQRKEFRGAVYYDKTI